MKYLITYDGSMNEKWMKVRCPRATLVTQCELQDYKLSFKKVGTETFATLEPAEGYSVPVVIWYLDYFEMKILDRFYQLDDLREKTNIQVELFDIGYFRKEVTAVAYLIKSDIDAIDSFPSPTIVEELTDEYLRQNWELTPVTQALASCK